jgi:arsenical resistance protein ArsH
MQYLYHRLHDGYDGWTSTPVHKVQELRTLAQWAEGMVWCSPERHGAMTGIYEAQIDWIPLSLGTVRPTQGKTPAVMQVSGGSQSFNAVNQLRVLGRWMRMITLPNQSSVAKAFLEFDDAGRVLSVLKSKVDQCGSQRSMTATGVRS